MKSEFNSPNWVIIKYASFVGDAQLGSIAS